MKSPAASMLGKLAKWLRPHWLFLVAAPIALVAMTTPTFHLALDTDTFRVHTGPNDIFMKYWDAWYGGEMLAGRAEYFHTDLLFHPDGVSLAFHNFSLPHMFVFGSLQAIFAPFNAYLLSYLLVIAANLAASYLFLLRLVSRPAIACAGAFVVGLSVFVTMHQEHPDLALVATIPLFLLGMTRAAQEGSWRWAVFAGFMAGFTAFIGMYVFICLLITLGLYGLWLAWTCWRESRFWQLMALILLVAGAISLLRVYPMIADRAQLSEALDKKDGRETQNDLLMLFFNTDHPMQEGLRDWLFQEGRLWRYANGYLGYLPLAAVGICLLRGGRRKRREMLPWLAIALFFIVLRLGSFLRIGGVRATDIPMPKAWLDAVFPWIFEAVWNISHFHIGILLPWAALFAISLDRLLGSLSTRKRIVAVILTLLVICFENYSDTQWMISEDPQRLAWIDWLDGEGTADDLRLIHLPMGRANSKAYGYFQTFNRIPHVDGLASRTPDQAYKTINRNQLLRAWRDGAHQYCLPSNESAFLAAVDGLRGLGFTHIIYHRQRVMDETVFAGFDHVPSVYDDSFVSVFLVDDLPYACDRRAQQSDSALSQERLLEDRPVLRVHSHIPTVTILDESLVTLSARHSEMRVDPALPQRRAPADALLTDAVAVLLAYDAESDSNQTSAYRDWLADSFQHCQTLTDEAGYSIEVMAKRGYPCELFTDKTPLRLDYRNGLIRLTNLSLEIDERALDISFLWRNFADNLHSFSLQLEDSNGERALGYDQVIDRNLLARHRIDVSALPAGDYEAKLIVYNYETGKSVNGLIVDADAPFQREVDIGAITLD